MIDLRKNINTETISSYKQLEYCQVVFGERFEQLQLSVDVI